MEILKQGKIPDEKKQFNCQKCGCVFSADKGEHMQGMMQYNETEFIIQCPCCGAKCHCYE